MALNGPAFVETGGIGCDVLGLLIASCMFEFHIREFLGHVDGRVHVAKGRGEDQVGTVQRHLRHHPL